MLSKKATKIYEIYNVDKTLYSKCQIDGEDFVNCCGLLRKHKLQSTLFMNSIIHKDSEKYFSNLLSQSCMYATKKNYKFCE